MKTFLVLGTLLASLVTTIGQATRTADARMYCLSVKFSRGTFNPYSLDLTGINNGINGELYPIFQAPRTHHSFLRLNDPNLGTIPGEMILDVPDDDANGNGFPDFFEVSEPFSGASSGLLNLFGSGTVSASWSRAAGSHSGTCNLTLTSSSFGSLGTFRHTFEVIEYTGPLAYSPGTSTVSGDVDLTQTGVTENRLQGPISFAKSPGDPHNTLMLQSGEWATANEQTLSFLAESYDRDPGWPTNYYGYFEFSDWDLNTSEPDYYLWVLSIDDSNDADQDGIPDFSDDPQDVTARRPVLLLTHTATELLLTINGDAGQACEIQEASSITATEWLTVLSVTLMSDPQVVSLSLPQSGPRFWRVRVQ